MNQPSTRVMISSLALSAAGFVGLVAHEGYSDSAVIPVAGDRATVGFGSTFNEDGTPVKMGDKITPPKAVQRSYAHIAKDEVVLKGCVKAPLHPWEYDTLVNHAYQYGPAATCSSEVVKLINAGKYAEACDAYKNWRFAYKRDCAIRSNGCYGVWTRALERVASCKGPVANLKG